MAETRLKASTDMAHHAALAPNSPDGSRPPAKSLERCGGPYRTSVSTTRSTHLPQCPVGHHSEDLVPASVGQLHRGERKLHLPLHSRQRLFDQPLPGSYEPILRAVLGVPYPVGHEVHLSPLLACPHDAPQPCGTASASCSATSDTAATPPSRRASITPNRSSLSGSCVPLVPRRVRPQHHLFHPTDAPVLQPTLAT